MSGQTSWMRYYNSIRDPSWPDCVHEDFFSTLPNPIQNEILTQHNGREMLWRLESQVADWLHYDQSAAKERLEETDLADLYKVDFIPLLERQLQIKDCVIYYDDFMECGGLEYGQSLPRIIQGLYPQRKFSRTLEWCSGGGFAGFRLLIEGICDTIDFMDVYRPSLRGCEYTAKHLPMRYQGCVTTHHAYRVEQLENVEFDLVIGLPPWFSNRPFAARMFDTRRCIDRNWQSHKEFFSNIAKHLAPGGLVILAEHPWGSGPEDFESWITQGGLRLRHCFSLDRESFLVYYMVLERPA